MIDLSNIFVGTDRRLRQQRDVGLLHNRSIFEPNQSREFFSQALQRRVLGRRRRAGGVRRRGLQTGFGRRLGRKWDARRRARPLGCRSANGRLVRSGGTRHWPRRERSFDATQHANCQSKPDQDQPTYDRDCTGCDDRRIECAPLDWQTRSHKKNSHRSYCGTQNQQKRIHTPAPPIQTPGGPNNYFDRPLETTQGLISRRTARPTRASDLPGS